MVMRGFVLAVVFAAAARASDVSDYKLDLKGPNELVDSTSNRPPPSRVEIYVTGPGMYVDKLDTPERLSRGSPACTLTNHLETTALIQILAADDNKERIPNIMKHRGRTYHLLLFNKASKTIMHYRVFESMDVESNWMHVDPRSYPRFVYFNKDIGSWLHAHVKIPTSPEPRSLDSSTNAP